MDPFRLTDDMLTGVDDIDTHHRKLFALANRIVDPDTHQDGDASFFASLTFLVDYVHYHFAAEELAMKKSAYRDAERHTASHARFRGRVAQFLGTSPERLDMSEIRAFLDAAVVGWLTQHIRGADRALALHLREHAGDRPATLPGMKAIVAAGLSDRSIDMSRLEAASDRMRE